MPIKARRLVKKMRGGAQAHLLEADDGNFYVVKFRNNPQHRRILVNELICSEFLRYLQISSAAWDFVELTSEFIEDNREISIQLGSRSVAPEAGWHFGSRFPGDPSILAVYDFLPDVLLGQVVNRSDFAGVLAFDKWVANADSRQAVFFRARLKEWNVDPAAHPRKLGFVALMIDHGFAFNGPHWDFSDSPPTGLYMRKSVYDNVRSMEDFQPWLDRIRTFPEDVIDRTWKRIPPEWVDGEEPALEHMLETLLRRRNRVEDFLSDARLGRTSPFQNWT